MKKIAILAIVFILAMLISNVTEAALPTDESGNTLPIASGIGILSPQNRTYNENLLTLKVSFAAIAASNIQYSVKFSLDGEPNETIPLTVNYWQNSFQAGITGAVNLPELSEGAHIIIVYQRIDIDAEPPQTGTSKDTVYFTVDENAPQDTRPPTISNVTIKNTTFWTGEMAILASFYLNEDVSWIGYCVDNQVNKTLTEFYRPSVWGSQFNMSLRGLSAGLHSLIIYANDTEGNTGVSDKIYFSVAPDYWCQQAPMPTPRFSFGTAVLDGKIFAIGGASSTQSGLLLAVNEEYDPSLAVWFEKATMPTPRCGFAVATYGGKIYVFGGQTNSSSSESSNVTEVYIPVLDNPTADKWETRASMPTAASYLQANVVGDKIYLIGGSPNGTLNQVYDPATDRWSTKESIPNAAYAYASAVVDNKIYIISNVTQIYNPETDTWSLAASIPNPVASPGSAATTGVSAPKAIYVIGGEPIVGETVNIFAPQNFTQVYFPENNSWNMGASMILPVSRLSVAVLNDTLYAIGGTRAVIHKGLSDTEQYTPLGYREPDSATQTQTVSPTSKPIQTSIPTASLTPQLPTSSSQNLSANPTQSPVASVTQTLIATKSAGVEPVQTSTSTKPQPTFFYAGLIIASVATSMLIASIAIAKKRKTKLSRTDEMLS